MKVCLPGLAFVLIVQGSEVCGHQTAPQGPGLQQQRLPPDTPPQSISHSRFRAGHSHDLSKNRALAWYFPTVYCGAVPPRLTNHVLALD
eukprot:7186202-Pyramimonas_sp.AAC.1